MAGVIDLDIDDHSEVKEFIIFGGGFFEGA